LAHALPASLEGAAEALELENRKGDSAAMRRLSRPKKDGSWEDSTELLEALYTYCGTDVTVERELAERLPPLSDAEQLVWQLAARVNDAGFPIDSALLEGALKIVTAAEAELEQELRQLSGGEVTTVDQADRLRAWLEARGCSIPNVQKRTVSNALRRKDLTAPVRRALELRRAGAHTASVAKFAALRAYRAEDGRIRGTLKYHGAGPGRWVGAGPQPQNFRRATITPEMIERVRAGDLTQLQAHYAQPPLEIVGDIGRAIICAPPGKRLICGDFSGIESIVTAELAGQRDKVELWRRFIEAGGPDPYLELGTRCGVPEEQARDIGKRCDLAFGFGGGLGAWQRMSPENDATR
jgi:DNA polymerase